MRVSKLSTILLVVLMAMLQVNLHGSKVKAMDAADAPNTELFFSFKNDDPRACISYGCPSKFDMPVNLPTCAVYSQDFRNVHFSDEACPDGQICPYWEFEYMNQLNYSYTIECQDVNTTTYPYSMSPMQWLIYQSFGIYFDKQLPGESCDQASDCYSGICDITSSHCVGAHENDKCKHDRDCNQGLYCSKTLLTCQPQADLDEFCDKDTPCVNWGECNKGFQDHATCQRKFSLPDFHKLDTYNNIELCQSNFTNYTEPEQSNPSLENAVEPYVCIPGPYLNATQVRFETDSQDCFFNQLGLTYMGVELAYSATCQYSLQRLSICPIKQGDPPSLLHEPYWRKFWEHKPLCHMLNPVGCDHAQMAPGFWNYMASVYELQYSVALQGNDECMKVHSEYRYYWDLIQPGILDEFDLNQALSLASASSILLMSLILSFT